MDITLCGMNNLSIDLQLKKAYLPIWVTPFGISIDFSEIQSAKAWFPILNTVLGTTTVCIDLHNPKAQSPIHLTPSEIHT